MCKKLYDIWVCFIAAQVASEAPRIRAWYRVIDFCVKVKTAYEYQGPQNSGAEGARAPPLFCSNNVLLKKE